MAFVRMRKGLEKELDKVPVKDGQLLFTTDTGKIYLDVRNSRVYMGNSWQDMNDIIQEGEN